MSDRDGTVRTAVVYREGNAYVEIRVRPRGWFGEVRVWRGARWPKLDRRRHGAMKRWIPWYSLETQAMNAVRYVSNRDAMPLLAVKEVRAAIERLTRHP